MLISFASSGVTAEQYAAVTVDAAGTVALVTGPGAAIDGIVQTGLTAANAGEDAPVSVSGVTYARAAGILTAGTHRALMVDATGRMVPFVATNKHVANWLPHPGQIATVAGDIIQVVLIGSPAV